MSSEMNKVLKKTVQGRSFVSLEFFSRYAIYLLGGIFMLLCYIGNKYIYQSRQEQIISLQKELDDARTDLVDASARYNSMVRESHMTAYLDTFGITLMAPDQPPFVIK